jgi:hypothetical protein
MPKTLGIQKNSDYALLLSPPVDAYCENLNNRRLQQTDNLKSLIAEVEGMVSTKLIILLMMHNIFSLHRI